MSVKGKGHSLTLARGHSEFKLIKKKKLFGHLDPKVESLWENGNEMFTNELAAMSIYRKHL